MEHSLLQTIVACFVSAFLFGLLAKKLKFPAIFGYLIAGIVIGPHTPGMVANVAIANQLAEIGVILLMFGVGLHFSFHDLMNVRKIALPGALFQMLMATIVGAFLIQKVGFSWTSAIIFGFSLSVASTVVLIRALEQRHLITTKAGKISLGWLIVEDIVMVLSIVLLPVLGGMASQAEPLDTQVIILNIVEVLLKIAAFAVLMYFAGLRVLPAILIYVAKTKSRELTSLSVLAIATGFAYIAYTVFGVSFALGAFLAGLVLNESEIGHKAAEHSLPLRDTFAVLFFVSVGMLFDPTTLITHPWLVLGTLLIITVGKSLAALIIMALFRQSLQSGAIIAVSLAQIGEFSFIFSGMAFTQGLLPQELYNLILAGALLSIASNHFLFKGLDRWVLKKAGS